MRTIHQITAGYTHGDAISNEVRTLDAIFRGWGCATSIFCEKRRTPPDLRGAVRDIEEDADSVKEDDIAFLHLSIGSPVNEFWARLKCRKVVLYHNITPAEYFRGVKEATANALAKGREQAKRLAGVADVVLACSRYNAEELEAWGYGKAGVLPLVLDFGALRGKADRATLRKYRDGLVNVLFVGRCAPNKRIEDLLNAFHYFQKYVQPASRLIHVGSIGGMEQYHALLLTHSRNLGLNNVHFLQGVPQAELNALYEVSRVFLCMSEHEGFCIPLIEAMVHRVPVVAYAAAAVPETLDGAGVLVREKRFDLIAEVMGRLVDDAALRESVLKGQDERLARYEAQDLGAVLREQMAPVLS